jgi:hypothetical protein
MEFVLTVGGGQPDHVITQRQAKAPADVELLVVRLERLLGRLAFVGHGLDREALFETGGDAEPLARTLREVRTREPVGVDEQQRAERQLVAEHGIGRVVELERAVQGPQARRDVERRETFGVTGVAGVVRDFFARLVFFWRLFLGLGLFFLGLLFYGALGLADRVGDARSTRFADVALELGRGALDLDFLDQLAVGAIEHLELEGAFAHLARDDDAHA